MDSILQGKHEISFYLVAYFLTIGLPNAFGLDEVLHNSKLIIL